MRKLLLGAVLAAAAVLPAAPASAVCGWTLEGVQHCGCLESEIARQVDAVTTPHGAPSLNEQIVCAH